jgi:hypothetical protein
MSQQREPRVCQPSVNFADPQIKTIDTELGEAPQLWYSLKDYNQINRKNQYEIRALKKAVVNETALDEQEYCVRGLEHKLSIQAQLQRQINTFSVIQSVLDEQRRQRELGVKDPTRLAFKSKRQSQESCELALERAKLDELATISAEVDNTTIPDNHRERGAHKTLLNTQECIEKVLDMCL